MKKHLSAAIVGLVAMLAFGGIGRAQQYVNPYTRSNGTQVQGYYRSAPDGSPYNNYSYPGNVNPYTGKEATGNSETYLEHNDRGGSLGSGTGGLGSSDRGLNGSGGGSDWR